MAGLHSGIAVGEYCALWLVSIVVGCSGVQSGWWLVSIVVSVHSGWCAYGLVALVIVVGGHSGLV